MSFGGVQDGVLEVSPLPMDICPLKSGGWGGSISTQGSQLPCLWGMTGQEGKGKVQIYV